MAVFSRALDVVATVLMIVASVAVILAVFGKQVAPINEANQARPTRTRQPPPVPSEPIPIVASATVGPDSATIVVMLFSEFECPFCRKFAVESFPRFKIEYLDTGKAQLVFRHLPLPIHRNAFRAAEAAECARRTNGFWQMHDLLFARAEGAALTTDALSGFAEAAGLNLSQFGACLNNGLAASDVKRDEALARNLGITGTPAFVVGRREGAALRATSIHRGLLSADRLGAAVNSAVGTK